MEPKNSVRPMTLEQRTKTGENFKNWRKECYDTDVQQLINRDTFAEIFAYIQLSGKFTDNALQRIKAKVYQLVKLTMLP